MTPTKTRYPRDHACIVARELCRRLTPVCERIVLAGSLRRGKPEVGDIEIVYIPRLGQRPADLLSEETYNLVDEEIDAMIHQGVLSKRPSKSGSLAWGPKNKLALHCVSQIPVDLFSTDAHAWHNYLVCRTGPAASNTRIASEALRRGYRWNPYGSGYTRLSDGAIFPMQSEQAVFEFVGLPFNPIRWRS